MIWEIAILVGVIVAQQFFILGLINRMMLLHGVSPLRLPSIKKLWHDPIPKPEKREREKPIFTVPIGV